LLCVRPLVCVNEFKGEMAVLLAWGLAIYSNGDRTCENLLCSQGRQVKDKQN